MTNFKLEGDRCGSAVINAVVGDMRTLAHSIQRQLCHTIVATQQLQNLIV